MARTADAARRNFLKRGLIGAGTVIAVLAGSGKANAAITTPVGGISLRLAGRGFHAFSPTLKRGELPVKGESYTIYGELVNPSGERIGDFTADCVAIDSPFEVTGSGVGSMETQTLNLGDGSIVGVGSGSGALRTYADAVAFGVGGATLGEAVGGTAARAGAAAAA